MDEDIFRRLLGIFDEDVEIAIIPKDAGVEQFIFHVCTTAALAGLDQIGVRVGRLRILVQVLHIRMGWRAVEVEIIFFNVFAVITLAVRQPEHAFFQDRILAIPQGQAEAQQLLIVADSGDTILTPVIGARAGLVMREVVPRVSVIAIVLADRPPLAFAKVRTPFLPGRFGGYAPLPAWLIPDLGTK